MSAASSPEGNEAGGTLEVGRLRLEFQRQGDRFAHTLHDCQGEFRRLLFASVEGDAEEVWPVSPPYQNLSIEPVDDGRSRAFLVGMAGTSHWSACIEPALTEDELSFDIACRVKERPRELASRCAAGGDGHWEIQHDRATLFLDDDTAVLSVEAFLPGTTLAIDTPGWLVVSPTLPAGERWPQTVRWGYRVRRIG